MYASHHILLWLEYNLRSVLSLANVPGSKLEFPVWMSSTESLYYDLENDLGIQWPASWQSCEQKASGFITPELVHNAAAQSPHSALGEASDALYSLITTWQENISMLRDSAEFTAFCDQHLAWLESAATLVQDERSLWREKINSMYYLINRNS